MEIIKVASPQIGIEEIDAVAEVLLSGNYVSGAKVAEFERQFAAYVGTAHAVAFNSGTASLHAALMASGVGPGDEVVVPALTFFSTITSVIHQNAVPVLADISPDNFSLCPESFERCISPRTRAVIPVHYLGHAAEMDAIRTLAEEKKIAVIEDCAQAHGTTYRGQRVGSIGQIGAFSFFATKHMTTGEGGAATTDSSEWAEKMRMFRNHGMQGRDSHEVLGYNYRMTEIAAAIGIVQLGKMERLNAARVRHSESLISRLTDIPWLTLPSVPGHVGHTYFWCHVLVDEDQLSMTTRDLIGRLREEGVEVRNRYIEPLYKQPLLTSNVPPILKLVAGDRLPAYGEMFLPNVEAIAGKVIGLPNRPDMTEDEMDRVADVLHRIGT